MKNKFNIEGMTCASCQAHVKKAVESLPGIKDVNVNLLKNTMDVEYDDQICNINNIEKSVEDAGYKAVLPNEKKKDEITKDNTLKNLIISIILLLVLMYFSMGHMMFNWPTFYVFDMKENPMGFGLIQFLILLPIIYINKRYFKSGFKKLIHLSPNMDSLISIGATSSIIYGIYCLFMISLGHNIYHKYLYFESAAMILVFVSIGKYLEGLSKKKTTKALEKLINLSPKTAIVIRDNKEVELSVDNITLHDIVIVKKGSMVSVDGVIIEGCASINESNITGESIPVYKKENDSVIASTIVESGYIKVKPTKINNDTEIANIIKLVEEASNSKADISKLVDKISLIFVPMILLISLIVFFSNFIYIKLNDLSYIDTNAFEVSFNFAITVIVIACPCALGLATPVAIMVSTGKAAENGLIIRNAHVLENAHLIKTIVLDKTGTITKGYPIVTDFIKYDNSIDLLSIIYSLEIKSEHPLAKSIVDFAKNNSTCYEVINYEMVDGKGLYGIINSKNYYLGNINGIDKDLISDSILNTYNELSKTGKTVLLLKDSCKILAVIALKDEIKESSKEAITLMKKKGINVIMLTGDNQITANTIAKELDIDNVYANVLPIDKDRIIKELKNKYNGYVAMVGDGVNDALALTSADVSIAIGCGSDIAIETSDIILIRNDLKDILNVINLSNRTIKTIKLGLFWAFFYNFICVILATGIFYHLSSGQFKIEPMYGAIAMSISSVSVVLNALTINKFKGCKTNYFNKERKEEIMETITINVEGMMCMHCKAHVEGACKKVNNVVNATASLENKNVVVEYVNSINKEELIKNIVDAGYIVK